MKLITLNRAQSSNLLKEAFEHFTVDLDNVIPLFARNRFLLVFIYSQNQRPSIMNYVIVSF